MRWDQPHWSGRPQASAPSRQRLRPNGFARLARFSATQRLALIALSLLLTVLMAGFAMSRLAIDPDQRPRIALDDATAKLQAELGREFPALNRRFWPL